MDESWIDLLEIASSKGWPPLALATIDATGSPQVRSVICRHMSGDGSLWITSDARSQKHRELLNTPRAAAVAWCSNSRQQFRVSGTVELVTPASEHPRLLNIWQSLSPQTKATFFWPAPGRTKDTDNSAFIAATDASQPPDSFEAIVLHPNVVEYLCLSGHPHERIRWTLGHDWIREELNP